MLTALDHLVNSCFHHFHCVQPSRDPEIDNRLHNKFSNFDFGNSIPESSFGVQADFSPAVQGCEQGKIYVENQCQNTCGVN